MQAAHLNFAPKPPAGVTPPVTPSTTSAGQGAGAQGFQQVLSGLAPQPHAVEVVRGDTLIGLVKAHHRQQQWPLSEHQAFTLAHQIAQDNRLDQADLIHPGQKIDFSRLNLPPLVRPNTAGPLDVANTTHRQALSQLTPPSQTVSAANILAQRQSLSGRGPVLHPTLAAPGQHPVLDKTLARAAQKGFVPAAQLPDVKQKVLQLAQRYNFAPDDFARLSLMESGGMNPQASNGRCHGIIQFCDGANRGAAAVGFKNNPRAILGMGLLQQLDLVDKYFAQAGLSTNGPPLGLDDLYLTVLTPAARQEKRPDAPLPIAGPQARALHVGADTQAPITRQSLLAGLHALTQQILGTAPAKAPARGYADATTNGPTVRR